VESEIRRVCVLFLDIRGFTTFSEKRTPPEVVNHLNQVFDFMIQIINDNGGIVNKFLGDGFMALFGAPLSYQGQDSANAVRAALAIRVALLAANARGDIAETHIGIGIHVGDALVGNVGSASRKEYSIIGDVVNLASRVESLNKQFHSEILITRAVREELPEEFEKIAKPLGPVSVKGREEQVQIFKLA
jgi:adenylate cyclase